MSTDITWYYWTNSTQSLESVNVIRKDVSRPFPNLIPTETLVFCLYLSKFSISLVTYH